MDRVGELLLLPNTEYATTEQIANYYGVDMSVIRMQISSNREEIMSDGVKNLSGKDTKKFLVSKNILLTNYRGYFETNGQRFSNRNNLLFPKRAILRIGMLLRDSEVAKEVRTRLLDVVQDTEESSPEIVQNVVNEISEEKQLMLDRVEAEMSGNYDEVCVVNAKLFALKNKRIKELEKENEEISTHALTIIESKDVINRIVRTIAVKEYNGMFNKAFGELYAKMNYILGINIKSRGKKNGSYLNSLTEEETYKVEEIVRNWAVKLGLDLDNLLKIA
ncbi:hypothetical protein [Methanobrevibacter sp. UBA417]|uniref:hypothetical protein n=1 Tax=Methanobrevibacter sp. UBA417 TaxID=1915487 RepID=UPI0039B92118